MADIDLKTSTPDTSLPTTGFLFGADSQAASAPSVYSTQTVATTLLGSTSLTGATITADAPVLNLSQTWNAGGVTFTGLKLNVTNTASASGSFLMDLQIGGTSNFAVRRYTSGPYITLNNNGAWIGGKSVSGTNLMVLSGNATGTDSAALSADNFYVGSSIGLGFCGGSIASNNIVDTILTRRGAANLRLGAADAAAPVAQTLSVQSVVAGTSNTAGANLTITGSQGTGTGAGGSIIFQVAPAGSSGTAQNALSAALTITPVGGASPLFTVPNFSRFVTNNLAFTENSGYYRAMIISGGAPEYRIAAGGAFSFAADAVATTSPDVLLRRDAANTLALRNGANAQEFRVYCDYSDATNYSYGQITTASNVMRITPVKLGTGTLSDLYIYAATGGELRLGANGYSNTGWAVSSSGHFRAQTDNTYDIGASGANRPRNVYVAGSVVASGGVQVGNSNTYAWANGSYLFGGATTGAVSGAFRLVGSGSTTTLNFGGDTSSFPALKRSTTSLQAVLANDTGFTNIQGKLTTDTAYTAGDPTTTGYLVVYDSTGTAYKIPAVAV